MSASLVGSEMCIRDSVLEARPVRGARLRKAVPLALPSAPRGAPRPLRGGRARLPLSRDARTTAHARKEA
eukprot:4364214-Alexandrium_andersonii.AAC.1